MGAGACGAAPVGPEHRPEPPSQGLVSSNGNREPLKVLSRGVTTLWFSFTLAIEKF